MAKENEDDFLQDISLAEEEMFGDEEHTEEELELDSLKAERDAVSYTHLTLPTMVQV